MIARGDRGGLANMLHEFAVHMRPERVLLMDLGQYGRGPTDPSKFDGLDVRIVRGLDTSPEDRAWLIEGSDVIYTAETAYGDDLWGEGRRAGVPTVLHVMPELYLPTRAADHIWLPTHWEEHRFPGATVMRVPVAAERFTSKLRAPARHFVHLAAPAMRDRNGTNIVLAALPYIESEIKFTLIGFDSQVQSPRPNLELVIQAESVPDYWRLFPDDADVLVLPRRFAGLSLPVQEAWARGMPAVMTAIEPQRSWAGVADVPPRFNGERVAMGSGTFDVVPCDPRELARVIDHVAQDVRFAEGLSTMAQDHAGAISWDRYEPIYREAFEAVLRAGRPGV